MAPAVNQAAAGLMCLNLFFFFFFLKRKTRIKLLVCAFQSGAGTTQGFACRQEEDTKRGMMAGAAEAEIAPDASTVWAVTLKPCGNFKGLCLELSCITPGT